jgi:hypothetical protein
LWFGVFHVFVLLIGAGVFIQVLFLFVVSGVFIHQVLLLFVVCAFALLIFIHGTGVVHAFSIGVCIFSGVFLIGVCRRFGDLTVF